jgi:hypothetical protein
MSAAALTISAAAGGLKVLLPKTTSARLPDTLALDTMAILDDEFARYNVPSLNPDQQQMLVSFVDSVKQRISWAIAARMSLSF